MSDKRILYLKDGHFVDEHNRTKILRGVNLSGSSKLPFGHLHDERLEQDWDQTRRDFFNHASTVSFINRPFPLEVADQHFARLIQYGFNCVRFTITWEAVEHAGPERYDYDYLKYLCKVLEIGASHNLYFIIDPHQDVWSRWCGGDGAPLWTLEKVGLEPRHFAASHAAFCMETNTKYVSAFPKMIWPTNYFKFASATMFTLFFGGLKYAPLCFVKNEKGKEIQVQEYLQSHYINAFVQVAKAVAGIPNVIGFGTMNEPSFGYIGVQDLDKVFLDKPFHLGYSPTPFQGMCLANGLAQNIGFYSRGIWNFLFGKPDRMEILNQDHVRAWKSDQICVWKQAGIYDIDNETQKCSLLKPHYFANVDFGHEFYLPFACSYMRAIRTILPHAFAFIELPPLEFSLSPFPNISSDQIFPAVNATHWYDGFTLFLQTWIPYFSINAYNRMPVFGRCAIARLHKQQLREIKELGRKKMQNAPTIIGETGIPYNLNQARAYRSKDYASQVEAMDHTISCVEANLLSYTLWCYCAENTNAYGDGWNLEDLSIVSRDKECDERYGRALASFVRPGPICIAGIPSQSYFDRSAARYYLTFEHSDECKSQITEVFVPHLQYPSGYAVCVSDGTYEIATHEHHDVMQYERAETNAKGSYFGIVV